jgi:predicted secreted protein
MLESDEIRIHSQVGKPVTIYIPANLTAGYQWEIAFLDPSLNCRQLPFKTDKHAFGAGGQQEFELNPSLQGEFIISFNLKRPWSPEIRKTLVYRISVKD